MSDSAEKKTPLYQEHVRLKARMVPFSGWLMPVQYTSIVDEHQTVREAVGMFDISHMGQFIVSAKGARDWLNMMLTNNVAKLDIGQGQYTFLLNCNGGVIDDLIVYRIEEAKFLLVVNAAKIDEDFEWLKKHLEQGRSSDQAAGLENPAACSLHNRSANFGGVAIQGPRTINLFRSLLGPDVELPHPVGCSECRGTGFRGRRAIGELLLPSQAVDRLILERADDVAIERATVADGMRPLFTSGLMAVLEGDTTIEEVVRCIRGEV